MNTHMDSLKMDWLTRMVDGRPVFVFADELGPMVPFAHGIEECAPFFEPWVPGFQMRYFNGAVAWGVPLNRILARAPRASFLECVRKADSPWVKGRPWPLAAIDWLAQGKKEIARSVLGKELLLLLPHDLHHMNAASIWFYLFDDREKAKMELEAAGCILNAKPETDPYRNELARLWSEMYGDHEKARTAINLEIMALAGMPDPYSYCEQSLAGAIYIYMRDKELAKKHVPGAERLGQHNCDWHGMDAAICWLALHGDLEMAKACAEIGKTQPSENPATHAMFCRHVFGDEAGARSILETRGIGKGWPQGVGPVRWAEGWLLCFGDREAAAAQLGGVQGGGDDEEVLATALGWRTLLADHSKCDANLADRLLSANMPAANLLHLAERCVMECRDIKSAQALIKAAEAQQMSSPFLAECARIWWQALADRAGSERCLQKAWDVAQTGGDMHGALSMEELLSWKWSEAN